MKFWRFALGVGVVIVAVAFWLSGRLLVALTVVGGVPGIWYVMEKTRKRDPQFMPLLNARLLELSKPKEFEIRPFFFEANLGIEVPLIEVTLYGINHHAKREAHVSRLVVTGLSVGRGFSLGGILGRPRPIPASNSELIYCRKELTEAEVRALARIPNRGWIMGSCSVDADIHGLRKKGPPIHVMIAGQMIHGTVVGQPSD